MGIMDSIKAIGQKWKNLSYARMLNGSAPIYSQFGTNIYASDVVQQALGAIVREMSKLNPTHIRLKGFDPIPVEDSEYQRVLNNPNFLMTTSEFIEKFMWNLVLHYNSFIYKEYDRNGTIKSLYPVTPTNVTLLEDQTGKLYLKMRFKNGYEATLPYERFIHLRKNYSVDDFMGGNEAGQPDNDALLGVLRLNDMLLQGVKKALNASFAINGVVKFGGMIEREKTEKAVREFEKQLRNSESGILAIDGKADYLQFKRDIKIVDEATLRFIDDKILRNFGVPVEIVRGNYTTEIYEAFYQATLEPFVIGVSQKFTKGLLKDTGNKGYKDEIKFYPEELAFMNMSQRLTMVDLLGQSGTLFENEKRVAFGYRPLKELEGIRKQSLNYIDTNIASAYQTQKNKMKGDGTNE